MAGKGLLKTPISYYGGKQRMLKHILPLIPYEKDGIKAYCEPFLGGGAVFFAKQPHEIEIINDTNRALITFYKILKNNFIELEKKIRISLHSRSAHADAKVIYENPHLFNDVDIAWSVWVLANQSFSSILGSSWGYDKKSNKTTKKITNARSNFTEDYAIRLQNVQIECLDATLLIQSRDADDIFFYCDPPYYNSNLGHYDGYTIEDFELLLKTLSNIKGKFLLSSYPSDLLYTYIKENKWFYQKFEKRISVTAKTNPNKKKIEVLTANYPIK